jgi:hypothetical protein
MASWDPSRLGAAMTAVRTPSTIAAFLEYVGSRELRGFTAVHSMSGVFLERLLGFAG